MWQRRSHFSHCKTLFTWKAARCTALGRRCQCEFRRVPILQATWATRATASLTDNEFPIKNTGGWCCVVPSYTSNKRTAEESYDTRGQRPHSSKKRSLQQRVKRNRIGCEQDRSLVVKKLGTLPHLAWSDCENSGLAVMAQADVVAMSEFQQLIAHAPRKECMRFAQLFIDKVGFEDDKLKATIIDVRALRLGGRQSATHDRCHCPAVACPPQSRCGPPLSLRGQCPSRFDRKSGKTKPLSTRPTEVFHAFSRRTVSVEPRSSLHASSMNPRSLYS